MLISLVIRIEFKNYELYYKSGGGENTEEKK